MSNDAEIAEIDEFIASATFEGIKKCLEKYKTTLIAKAAIPITPSIPTPSLTVAPPKDIPVKFRTIDQFSWDQGEYNSPTVTVYVDIDGIGTLKDTPNITCQFTKDTFDLKVFGLNGNNYRFLKDNLDKDIDPTKSKYIVKRDKVILKLAKVKGEYSFEHWTALTSKKSKEQKEAKKKDPMGGIMDMMKDMYDDGDENMKKIIGEAMMKSQSGDRSAPGTDMGGLGGGMGGMPGGDF